VQPVVTQVVRVQQNPSSSSEHLEHGLKHADDSAVMAIRAFGKPAQTVEVTEEFVSTVDKVHDHFGSMLDLVPAHSKAADRIKGQMFRRDPNFPLLGFSCEPN
jgi:hypothetical protein